MVKGKIVVIGATGTLGTYLVDQLVEEGYDVFAVGHKNVNRDYYQQKGIGCASVDIAKKEDFKKLPNQGIHTVVLLSGIMPARMKGYDPQKYIDVNITGTLNTLEFCRKKNIKKIIFSQTRADSTKYFGQTKPLPSDIEKSFPLKGDHSIYTISKNAAVDLIEHYYYEYGLKRFILRLPTIYAYHPDPYFYVNGKRKKMAYRYIIEQAQKGNTLEIWGDPSKRKEIVYVKDFTQIVEKALISELDGGMYNVGRGVGVTIEEQIRGIAEVFSPKNKKVKIIYRPDKPDARQFIHDISKTVNDLNYKPQYNYLSLLKDFKREMKLKRFIDLRNS